MERNRNRFFLLLTDFFENDQLFIILEFEFGGADLENSNGTVSKAMSEFSVRVVTILTQILAHWCGSSSNNIFAYFHVLLHNFTLLHLHNHHIKHISSNINGEEAYIKILITS